MLAVIGGEIGHGEGRRFWGRGGEAKAEADEICRGPGAESEVGGGGAGVGEGAGGAGEEREGDDAGLLKLKGFDAAESGLGGVGLVPGEDFIDGKGECRGEVGAGFSGDEGGEEGVVEGGGHGEIVRYLYEYWSLSSYFCR